MKMTLALEFANATELLLCSQALAKIFPHLKLDVATTVASDSTAPVAQSALKAVPAAGATERDYPPGADALDKTFIDIGAPMTEGVPVVPRELPDQEPAQRRKRRTKAEMEAARAAEQTPQTATVVQEGKDFAVVDAPAAKPVHAVTLNDIRAATGNYMAKFGASGFPQLLQSVGASAKNFTDIPQEKWPELLAKLESAVAGA